MDNQIYFKSWLAAFGYFWKSLIIWFFLTATLISYIKGGTPAQIFLEKGSAVLVIGLYELLDPTT
jgi:hypothetical protein